METTRTIRVILGLYWGYIRIMERKRKLLSMGYIGTIEYIYIYIYISIGEGLGLTQGLGFRV